MNLAARSYLMGEGCQVDANEAWEGGATGGFYYNVVLAAGN